MELSKKLLFIFFLCSSILLLFGIEVVESSSQQHHHHGHVKHGILKKLFVFGDSYVDTGNTNMDVEPTQVTPWREPYGVTFPGKPFGRYADGRVYTDYLARYLGLKSPVPYKLRNKSPSDLKHGINFAFGGTGVFDTLAPYPNMTTQIEFFERLLKESVLKPSDLQNSIAHVSLAGNDYYAFLVNDGSITGFLRFIPRVVNQLAADVQRISNLGVKKVSVAALPPLGCLPGFTRDNSYQNCKNLYNKGVMFHNLLLQRAISRINKQTPQANGSPKIVFIDLYKAFNFILHGNVTQQGGPKFKHLLKSCCAGISKDYYCSIMDEKGNKMYTLCQDPNSYFFWDDSHPTQAGWEAVMVALQSNLEELHR